jgi:hypothetical protein
MNQERTTIHTKSVRMAGIAALFVVTLAYAPLAPAAGTPEQKCEAGKNDAAGKYAACVSKAEKSFVTGGDAMKYAEALGKCEDKYGSSWAKLEQKAVDAATTCPSTGDETAIQDFVDACTQSVAEAVGGGTLPLDVGTCNTNLTTCDGDLSTCEGDLAACESSAGGLPRTGQTTSYGAGSDGAEQRGAARSFTDNGDGTITDNVTGLMWEKKSDDDSIHDVENQYTWSTGTNNMDGTIVTTFLADLNGGGGFAGHTDWCIPNVYELQSLVNFAVRSPSAFSEFNSTCTGGCTVTTCSCTPSGDHWSSTTLEEEADGPIFAWVVDFYKGNTNAYSGYKEGSLSVRAVRSGS